MTIISSDKLTFFFEYFYRFPRINLPFSMQIINLLTLVEFRFDLGKT